MRASGMGMVTLIVGTFVYADPPVPRYPNKSNLLLVKDDAGKSHPVKSAKEWDTRRKHILEGMQEIMGQLPSEKEKIPLDVQYTTEVKTPKYTRKKLTFAVEKGDRVPAWLLIPHDLKGKVPAVLCLHQTIAIGKDEPAGLGKNQDLAYAHHLAERGYVTLAPDYPSFGEYTFDFKKSKFPSGSMKAIWNNLCAVDLLESLPEVDKHRIGVIGHSLGGHNGMFTAAFDTRLKVIVSNCGFTSATKYYGGNLKGWTSDRYMPRVATIHKNKPDRLPFDFPEIVASFAPRAFLASSPMRDSNFEVSGVKDCMAAARPVYELLGAKEKLQANYPDVEHTFPEPVRKVAYDFLDRWLKGEKKKTGKLEMSVRETAGLARFDYPVHATFELPREVRETDRFRLLSDGKPVPAQFRSLAGMGKKTAVALDFHTYAGPMEKKSFEIEYGPDVVPMEPKAGMTVEETKERFTIRSGSLAYQMPKDGPFLTSVESNKKPFLGKEAARFKLVSHRSGGESTCRHRGFTLTRQGPLACAFLAEGESEIGPDRTIVKSTLELTFPRAKSWVEAVWTVDDPTGEVLTLFTEFFLDVVPKPTLVDFGTTTVVYTTLRDNELAVLSRWNDSKLPEWEIAKGTKDALRPFAVSLPRDKNRKVEGWAHVMDATRATALAVDQFGETSNEVIRIHADGRVFLSRTLPTPTKGKHVYRFGLHFVPMPVQVGAVTSPQSMMAPLAVEVKAGR
jgi:dienelactone hydrolase